MTNCATSCMPSMDAFELLWCQYFQISQAWHSLHMHAYTAWQSKYTCTRACLYVLMHTSEALLTSHTCMHECRSSPRMEYASSISTTKWAHKYTEPVTGTCDHVQQHGRALFFWHAAVKQGGRLSSRGERKSNQQQGQDRHIHGLNIWMLRRVFFFESAVWKSAFNYSKIGRLVVIFCGHTHWLIYI
jgi:hypothetical protein